MLLNAAEGYPFDTENYAEYVEPSGPNMADDGFVDGFVFLLTSGAVLLLFFSVGVLFSLGAKRLGIRRPLSFLILLVSFAPSVFHAQYVRGFLLRGISGYRVATVEQIRIALSTFTSASLLYALTLFLLGTVCVWRAPWTVLLAPFAYSTVYTAFPLRPLTAALVGTDITIDGLAFLWLGIHTVMVACGVLGWLLGREVSERLRYRLERRSFG